MKFFTLPVNAPEGAELEPFKHDSDDEAVAALMDTVAVRGKNKLRTVRDLLTDGQCIVVSDRWVVPEIVNTLLEDGEIGLSNATDCQWRTYTESNEHQNEFTIEARRGKQIAKVSKQVAIVRGWERDMGTAAMGQTINTKYGEMETSGLMMRTPRPGRREYWMPRIDNDPSKPLGPLVAMDTENFRTEVDPTTGKATIYELVHASQIATKD